MAKRTIRERLEAGLMAEGWTRDFSARTGRYSVWKRADDLTRMYVGRSGALRRGRTASGSFCVSDQGRARILARGDA